MGFKKAAMTAIAAASIVMVPAVAAAQTASASKLSLRASPAVQTNARTGASLNDENKLAGGSVIIAILAAAAIIAGIVIAADGDDDPVSP